MADPLYPRVIVDRSMVGPPGRDGVDGTPGTPGATGPAGTDGSDGAPGPVQWPVGSTVPAPGLGADGERYLRDTTGDVYAKDGGAWTLVGNLRGPQGVQGATGPTGATGATGATGTAGATGAPGAGATIEPGTVTTVASDAPATVTNSGTTTAAVFDFEIPQGAQGFPGPPGVPGADGIDPYPITVVPAGDPLPGGLAPGTLVLRPAT